jgi:tRNA threonylcarbamoyladenosine biosynthesis protein TsaB
MKILAIESSAMVASVAVVEDSKIICEYTLNEKKTHSQTIMPMVESIKKEIGLDLKTLDAIAVSSGPGSYTGLRIGSATAKGLAHVLDIPVIGISTIESMATNIAPTTVIICPMLDARRQHVFSGAYRYDDKQCLEVIIEINQISVVDLLEKLKVYQQPILFLGDGFEAHEALIRENMDESYIKVARPIEFLPSASALGLLAIERLKAGEVDNYMTHQPNYYRVSQAEREYEEKHNGHS